MSSLARRSLHTSAAAVGIAALGVGLAGHALAAPELPVRPEVNRPDLNGADVNRAAVADAIESATARMPAIPATAPELPALDPFVVPSAPIVPQTPDMPDATAPEAPITEGTVDMDLDAGTPRAAESGQSNQVGAMQDLDMAALVTEMARSAAAGESVTDDQQIG